MMYWKYICWLHSNLPYPFLKLWSSSDKFVSLTRKLAFGGDSYKRLFRLLQKMESWELHDVQNFQYKQLKKMLNHSYEKIPYYRKLFDKEGIKPRHIRSLEDLEKIPITTKEDVLSNYSNFFAKGVNYKKFPFGQTSGTSGKPIRYYYDETSIGASWAGDKYCKSVIGCRMDKDIIMYLPINNQPVFLFSTGSLKSGHYTPVTQQVMFSPGEVGKKNFKEYVKYIKKFRIKYIRGFPSIIYAFARYVRDSGEDIKIKTVFGGGETLYDFQRAFIEKHLQCEFFNRYGSVESTIRTFECCEHTGMHISPYGIAQVKDQGLVGKGELVMTNLMNFLMPLIRYNIKDVVTLSQKKM